jgi:hypothetical protein
MIPCEVLDVSGAVWEMLGIGGGGGTTGLAFVGAVYCYTSTHRLKTLSISSSV